MSTNFGNCPTCCANRREDRRIVDEGDDGDTYCADSWHATHTPPAPAPAEDRDIWQHDETGRIVELPAGSPSPGKRYYRVRGMGGRVSVVGKGNEARVVFTPDAPAPADDYRVREAERAVVEAAVAWHLDCGARSTQTLIDAVLAYRYATRGEGR